MIASYVNDKNETYFNSSRVEHIQKEIRRFNGDKNIITNIYRIQSYDWIMCVYFSIGFIDFMFKGKILLQYTTLFSANEYKRNDKIILKHFLHINKLKCILLFPINIENLKKKLKYHISLKKH